MHVHVGMVRSPMAAPVTEAIFDNVRQRVTSENKIKGMDQSQARTGSERF